MRLRKVVDIQESDVLEADYDLAVFASGYEKRATDLAQRLRQLTYRRALVLGFDAYSTSAQRKRNDTYFLDHLVASRLTSSAEDRGLLDALGEINGALGDVSRIFVDYSSMSKLWYAAILNWARYFMSRETVIDFGYSVAMPSTPFRQSSVRSVEAIPGFESTTSSSDGALVLGLGFDRFTAMSVLDQMEPDKLIAFIADPSLNQALVHAAERTYKAIVGHSVADPVIRLPLLSVEHSFRLLGEVVTPFEDHARVTIVPLGPKTHVLASLLTAMRYPHVGCLRVSTRAGSRTSPATGDVAFTRVTISPDSVLGLSSHTDLS